MMTHSRARGFTCGSVVPLLRPAKICPFRHGVVNRGGAGWADQLPDIVLGPPHGAGRFARPMFLVWTGGRMLELDARSSTARPTSSPRTRLHRGVLFAEPGAVVGER